MQTKFVQTLFDFFFGGGSTPTFPDGRFNIVNHTIATATQDGRKYSSELELSSEFVATGFRYEMCEVPVTTDFSGYNKRFMTEDGFYNLQAATTEFQKVAPGQRVARTEVTALALSSMVDDSHEAYLLNMLISWFLALLYQDSKCTDNVLKVKHEGYTDSHIKATFNGVRDVTTVEYEMGHPVDDLGDEDMEQRTPTRYWEKPLVLRYPAQNRSAAAFYLMHLFGRDKRSSINVDIDIPAVDFKNLSLDPIGGKVYVLSPDDVDWTNPTLMWMWIKDYVVLNRLEGQFASTLELFSAMAFQPMPSYQESTIWQQSRLQVNLARFTPTRARVPANLEGDPYREDNTVGDILGTEGSNPRLFMVVGAILNYAMWYGIYSLIDNESLEAADWYEVLGGMVGDMSAFMSPEMRAMMVSILFGKEVITYANKNSFITFSVGEMSTARKVSDYQVLEQGYPSVLTIEGIVPYVSGALLLGTPVESFRTTAHLLSSNSVTTDAYGTTSVRDAIVLCNMYRLFGHTASIRHDRSLEEFPMYANHRDCVINPQTLFNRTRPFDRLELYNSVRRDGRGDPLSPLAVYKREKTTAYVIDKPTLRVVVANTRSQVVRMKQVLCDRKKTLTFNVKGKNLIVRQNIVQGQPRVKLDFPVAPNETAPQIPVDPTGGGIVAVSASLDPDPTPADVAE